MTLPRRRLTDEEYQALPEDHQRYELLEGELFVTPAPSRRHQLISMALSGHLWAFTQTENLGKVLCAPLDVYLSPGNHLQPDIIFIARDRPLINDADRAVRGVPDLVIEILSSSNSEYDRVEKRTCYSAHGVPEYWIVDPESESIQVLTQQGEGLELWQSFRKDQSLTSPALSGLRLSLSAVFDY